MSPPPVGFLVRQFLGLLRFQLFLEISAMIGEFRSGRLYMKSKGFSKPGASLMLADGVVRSGSTSIKATEITAGW